MREQDKEILRLLFQDVPKSAQILDVGCGVGENLEALRSQGFEKIVGVDISDEMLAVIKKKGFSGLTPAEVKEGTQKYDVILMSHVIEHLQYAELQKFMENYFSKLNSCGKLVVLTPVLYDAFYNDVDHIKPYYPYGLANLFSRNSTSRQYASNYQLSLEKIFLRREDLTPYWLECRFHNDSFSRLKFRTIKKIFSFLKWVSLGLISKTTGYGARWEVVCN